MNGYSIEASDDADVQEKISQGSPGVGLKAVVGNRSSDVL